MSRAFAWFARAAAVATVLFANVAQAAGYSLYDKNDTKVDFNFMVQGAQFGQNESWFGESHSFLNASESHWTEFGTEPGLKFETKLGAGTLFGEVSGVYTRTSGDDASGITSGLDDESKMTLEQGHLGWKVDDVFSGLEDDTVTVQLGRFDYSIGTGMLVNDGGGDGGDRGGWYLGLRKAFQNGAMVSLDSKTLKAQVFHLKNNPRRGGNQGTGNGANVEYTFGEAVTLGATYMNIDPDESDFDNVDVFDGRASWTALPGLTFSGEYAHEKNDEIPCTGVGQTNCRIDDYGYYAQALYQFADVAWKPAFTYRYAEFEPNFNDIAYGYTDYGYWFQGEIAGNYPLANVNLKSNMLRAKLEPMEGIVVNVFYYNFKLVNPSDFGVSSDDFGDEVDLTCDWQATSHIYTFAVLGVLKPGNGAQQWVGNDKDWVYGMISVSYTL
jgi:hypothetical protein